MQDPLVVPGNLNVLGDETVLKCNNSSYLAGFVMILAVYYRFMRAFLFDPIVLMCLLSLSRYVVKTRQMALSDRPDLLPIGFVGANQGVFRDSDLLARLNITPQCFECIHSRRFVNYVDSKAIHFVEYKNFEDAIEDIKGAKIKAAIYFNDQFGDSFFRRLVSDQSRLDEHTIRNSKIVFKADVVSKMLHSWIENILLHAYDMYTRGSRANLNMKRIPLYPTKVEDSLVGNIKIEDHSFFDSIMFSLVINSIFSVSIL